LAAWTTTESTAWTVYLATEAAAEGTWTADEAAAWSAFESARDAAIQAYQSTLQNLQSQADEASSNYSAAGGTTAAPVVLAQAAFASAPRQSATGPSTSNAASSNSSGNNTERRDNPTDQATTTETTSTRKEYLPKDYFDRFIRPGSKNPALDWEKYSHGCIGLARVYSQTDLAFMPHVGDPGKDSFTFGDEGYARAMKEHLEKQGRTVVLIAVQTHHPTRNGVGDGGCGMINPREIDLSGGQDFCTWIDGYWVWINWGWVSDPARIKTARVKTDLTLPDDPLLPYTYYVLRVTKQS
jgi:hypothetical protein